MKIFIVGLSILACVFAQCNVQGTPIYGTFSSSGVYQVIRTQCLVNGNLAYTNSIPSGSYLRTFVDNVESDIFESASSVTPLTVGSRTFMFLLIDASASQVGYIQTAVNILVNGIRNGLNSNTAAYGNNVTMAAAFFDGRTDIQMISDWNSDWSTVLNTVSNQFTNFNAQSPSDPGTNLNGAYAQALLKLDRKMNDTILGLGTIPSGLIFTTGDTVDTSMSYYPPNDSRFPDAYWDSRISDIVINSGYRYGTAFSNAISAGASVQYNQTNPDATTFISQLFSNAGAIDAATKANQGYSLVRFCSPVRAATWDPSTLGSSRNPNTHNIQFALAGGSTGSTSFNFNSAGFSKGCDINTYINSAQSMKTSVVIVAVLAVLAALF